jgi:hypothetical protein
LHSPTPPAPRLSLLRSLADIASQAGLAGPAEAEVAVLRMVDAGEVAAHIRWIACVCVCLGCGARGHCGCHCLHLLPLLNGVGGGNRDHGPLLPSCGCR